MNIREKLQKIRDAGVTQEEIAAAIGLTQPSVSRLLRGINSDTSASAGERINKLLARVSKKGARKADAV